MKALPTDKPVAFVDMAGSSDLREKLHRHFGDQMKYSGRIGLTHRSTSSDEPAANVTTMVIGRVGQLCAGNVCAVAGPMHCSVVMSAVAKRVGSLCIKSSQPGWFRTA